MTAAIRGGLGMVGNHEDYHGMWIDPNDPEHFIIGGDAGIFQTWDRGGTYDSMNNMAMGQFYVVSYDYQVPYRVCGGLQDNGISCGWSRRRNGQLHMTDWFAVNRGRRSVHGARSDRSGHRLLRVAGRQHLRARISRRAKSTNIKPRTVNVASSASRSQRSRPTAPRRSPRISRSRSPTFARG